MSELIKAIRSDIKFGSISLDCYKLNTHQFEKRFGVVGVSTSLGYAENWFGRLPKRGVKQFKALQADGFTAYQIEVSVPRNNSTSGSSIAKTISIRDFNKVIAYEALVKKNVKAIILLVALSERGLENLISDAFSGQPLDWFAEKIVHYSQWTFEEREEVLAELREDVRALYSWSNYEPDYWDIDLRLDSDDFPPSLEL
uniref:Uncharacterized protein n=1 Tax=Johanseniella sp. A1345 TaxID=380087 RepID=A4L7C3_9NOST|nr:hypothetical protein [Johanseniella A1345]